VDQKWICFQIHSNAVAIVGAPSMSVNLSIKDVPDALAQALRERAARHHRSLQGELMAIIEEAAA
jgi:hypothetical protein